VAGRPLSRPSSTTAGSSIRSTPQASSPGGAVERKARILPGFGLTLGCTLFYLSFLVLIPFLSLALKAAATEPRELWEAISGPRALASYRVTLVSAGIGAVLNGVFGVVIAWILVRRRFPGRRLVDALVDLPFALPAAVGGIALTAVFGPNGWLGSFLYPLGIETAYSRIGLVIAVTFVGFPYVVRSVQPVLEDFDPEVEEAAHALGATPWQSFVGVVLPILRPAILSGFALALARGIGEYGAVLFISGNIPMSTEVTSLVITSKLDQYDYGGAAAVAMVMLIASFALLFSINLLQAWTRAYQVR
jgi:sulfate/thiosulfate transport system permease protein